MITSNVYHRVRQIRISDNVGTAFALDVDGRQYLVTANHLLEDWRRDAPIHMWHGQQWIALDVGIVGQNATADVAVFSPRRQICHPLALEPTAAHLVWSQDVYFLGYPHGWRAEVPVEINGGYPLPFVKKAIVSAMVKADGFETIFLDGHNNSGFSGGPVIFRQQGSGELKVCSIITGFRYVPEPIYDQGTELPFVLHSNTGIIESSNINTAVDLIRANPTGWPLP